MSEEKKREKILDVKDLDITFKTTAGKVHAIRGVNIDLYQGETVAIVGESGSGKSVTMRAAMGILAKNAEVNSGEIIYRYRDNKGGIDYNPDQDETAEWKEADILKQDKKWIRKHINGRRIAMVFQDPMTSLDPTMTIGKQIMEGMIWHYKIDKKDAYKRSVELLKEVGIEDAEKRMKQYPHQLSGGMRQRVALLRTYLCGNSVALLDEPFSALDTLTRASVHEWYLKVMEEIKLSTLFITHDIDEAILISDRICILKGQPAGITDEIVIDEPKPRGQDFVLSDKFLEYKRRIKLML